MADAFTGEIRIFGFTFPPYQWASCVGSLLPIQQNTALFSIIGTTYGGNGTSNFALPNLSGNFPMHFGQGPGLSSRSHGESGGVTQVTLQSTQMPAHTHLLTAGNQGNAASATASGSVILGSAPTRPYASAPGQSVAMNSQAIGIAGNTQAHENMPPYLAMNFSICLNGVFPQIKVPSTP
ncbi:phage tail protein [Comamonas sp. J-3]|uniref:phage tail protein n=1 Tax=Comamonas trifloxystrobinivorans TaxID=3350256 RepID=UPI003726C8EA